MQRLQIYDLKMKQSESKEHKLNTHDSSQKSTDKQMFEQTSIQYKYFIFPKRKGKKTQQKKCRYQNPKTYFCLKAFQLHFDRNVLCIFSFMPAYL